jgi:hypothetical protein
LSSTPGEIAFDGGEVFNRIGFWDTLV